MTLENFDTILAFAAIMLLLSLLITTLVKFTLAALGLRRKNLLWGVRRVLERSPRLKSHADKVARAALSHPAVSHSGQSADVIGSMELLRIVEDLVEDPEALEEGTRNALRSALVSHGVTDEAIDQARMIKERLRERFPDEADRLEEAIEETLSDTRQSASELASDMNRWFETVMNRVSARFRLQARLVTVGLAVVFAFVLEIDAIELIRDLSTDSEVRAAVVRCSVPKPCWRPDRLRLRRLSPSERNCLRERQQSLSHLRSPHNRKASSGCANCSPKRRT